MSALRSLTVSEQVALLFVILFGALLLVSTLWFALSLREMDEPAQQRNARFGRDLRVVWIGAAIFWLAWMAGPLGATLLFGTVSFLALREFITLLYTRRGSSRWSAGASSTCSRCSSRSTYFSRCR
jgi:phosphatidate cytidylyltransferase